MILKTGIIIRRVVYSTIINFLDFLIFILDILILGFLKMKCIVSFLKMKVAKFFLWLVSNDF